MTHRLSCALQIPPMWLGCTQTCCRQTTANSCTIRTLCPPCPGQSWRRLTWLLLITSPRCVYMPKMSFATLRKLEKSYPKWGSTKTRTNKEVRCKTSRLFYFSTQKRSHLVKQLNDSDPSTTSPLMEGTPTIRSRKKLLQIIDTTLLKCYLHVRRRLIPFLSSCVLWCCCFFVVNKCNLVSFFYVTCFSYGWFLIWNETNLY